MTLNSSGCAPTFRELESMISQWAYDTDEYVRNFWIQNEEMNKVIIETYNCNDKLYPISKFTVLAEEFQAVTEAIIRHNYKALMELENLVMGLEENVFCCCTKIPFDGYRRDVYGIVESIYAILTNLSQALSLLESKNCPMDTFLKGNFCDVVCVLNIELKQLQDIEIKIREIESKLNEANYNFAKFKFLFKNRFD